MCGKKKLKGPCSLYPVVLVAIANSVSQQHKQSVKEAKREKRKEKMPKHLKKKLVASTSRRKK